MTTLPQTTSVRLPRQAAASPLAVSAIPQIAAATQMTGADVVRILRANSLLIILSVIVFGVGGYAANRFMLKNWPRYTAVGLVQIQTSMVVDPVRSLATTLDQQQLQSMLKTQAQLLSTEALASDVLKNEEGPIRNTSWFKAFSRVQGGGGAGAARIDIKDAKEELLDSFRVSPVPDSALLRVTMTCSQPDDARVIVEEMVRVHLQQQRHNAEARLDDQTNVLNELRRRYFQQMQQYQMDVAQLTRKLGKQGMSGIGRLSMKEQAMADLLETLSKVQSNATEARSAYEGIMQQLQMGQDPKEVDLMADEDFQVRELRAQVNGLKIARATLLYRYAENHPTVGEMDKRIAETEKTLETVLAEVKNKARSRVVNTLRDAASRTQADLDSVSKAVSAANDDLAALNSDLASLITAQEDEKATRELYRQVNDQLRDMQTVQTMQNQSRIDWATHPEIPEVPSFPRLPYTMAAAIILGLALALSIAFLREFMDQTVRSPRDVARVGQMSLLGLIPDESDDPQAVNARLPLVIFEAPHSITAEQFRQVRTRLQHAASLDTTRSIMVTGPSPMDGKTTVACNLAAGLALNGRKILLVDANFRRPELHRIFQVGNDRGFSDVLTGLAGIDEIAHISQIPNLAIMPSGPKPMNPTELFESQLLIDFIERALEEYDHVIFDSGPLLVVSESVAMAPRVDGVVTVVKAHADSRGLLTRMRDTLRQIRAEHLGVILNAVRAQGGGYYRSNIKTYYEYQNGQD